MDDDNDYDEALLLTLSNLIMKRIEPRAQAGLICEPKQMGPRIFVKPVYSSYFHFYIASGAMYAYR